MPKIGKFRYQIIVGIGKLLTRSVRVAFLWTSPTSKFIKGLSRMLITSCQVHGWGLCFWSLTWAIRSQLELNLSSIEFTRVQLHPAFCSTELVLPRATSSSTRVEIKFNSSNSSFSHTRSERNLKNYASVKRKRSPCFLLHCVQIV